MIRVIWEVYYIERRVVNNPAYHGAKACATNWYPIRAFRKRENAVEYMASIPKRQFNLSREEYQISTYYRVRQDGEDRPPGS